MGGTHFTVHIPPGSQVVGAELVGCQGPQTPATHLCLADMWSQETVCRGGSGVGRLGLGVRPLQSLFSDTAPAHPPSGKYGINPEKEGLAQVPQETLAGPGLFLRDVCPVLGWPHHRGLAQTQLAASREAVRLSPLATLSQGREGCAAG